MKEFLCILTALMLALFFAMLVGVEKRCKDLEIEIKAVQDTCIYENEQLRKEMRILKTDMQILEEGTRK